MPIHHQIYQSYQHGSMPDYEISAYKKNTHTNPQIQNSNNNQPVGNFGNNLKPWLKFIYLACGFVSFGLAMLGIALPLLPTTPLLLLSAWFFAMSSQRFYTWLINHKIFGRIISDYRERGGVRRKLKVRVLILLWATILSSAIFFTNMWSIRIILVAIAIGVSIHLRRIKSLD